MESCNTFSDIDKLFIDYETNDEQFNDSYGSYNNYCPVKNGSKRCETDFEKLSAISGHAYVELTKNKKVDLESENELSADFLVMELSHILYKLSKDPNLSIKDAFENYLGKPMGGFNHWSILYNKKYFMGSNIGIMSGFYFLFKQICETINTYEKPVVQQYEYIYSFTQCYMMYTILYNIVSRCGPYLRLLDHLKTIYNEFIDTVIKNNDNDQDLRSKLIKLSPIDKAMFGSEFNTKGCKKLHNKLDKTTPKFITVVNKMLEDDEKRKNGEGSQSAEDKDDDDLDLDEEEDGFELDEEEDDFELDEEEDGYDLQNTSQGTPPVSAPGQQQPPQSHSEPTKPVPTPSGASSSIPDNGGDTTGSKDKVVDDTPIQENTKGSEQTDTGDGQDDKGGQVGGSNGDQGSQEGLGGSGDRPGNGPGNDPVEKGPHSTSGDPVDTGKSFFRIVLKGIDKLNTGLKFFEKHKNKITEAKETINNLYNTSMSNIKTAYDNSREILNSIIDNISNQPEKVDMTSTLDGNKLGSGGTGAGPPTPNGSSTLQKDSPQTPSGTPHTSLPSQNPKEQTNASQLPQGPSGNQSSDQNHQGGSKISVVNPMVKPGNSGTEVKGNGTTGIGDIYILKEYKQIEISIIVLLISIALAIMYKYLSYGWRKKLKRKKTIKKVINSIEGKRPVQIIIKSSIHKKQTKKSINSVHRKKPPLLNIYKLMQADPIPFINLFFLLIFFVYKRKLNYLEL
ncbi:hypothetical protein YYE_04752 [Plasmodium vinckei vinckei]|uniref:PIR protein CIR protein n=1 Tax=Plasmodium vinckei vinckei TaxID=54757 RepID=A0A081IA60_PLAVN|nr:hypothetical protein YYE_04752 [Plasmodium vinckei vinckei]